MPLTENGREMLEACDQAKCIVESEVEKYNNILRAVREWDAGRASFLVPEGITDTEVMATARERANEQRLKIIAAATALPEIGEAQG